MAKKNAKATEAEIKYAEYLYVEKNVSPQVIAEELEKISKPFMRGGTNMAGTIPGAYSTQAPQN